MTEVQEILYDALVEQFSESIQMSIKNGDPNAGSQIQMRDALVAMRKQRDDLRSRVEELSFPED